MTSHYADAGDVLTTDLVEEVLLAARELFDASAQADRKDQLRRELATVEREQARLTETVASGGDAIPVLVERLRATEGKRRTILRELEQTQSARQAPSWPAIERRMRKGLADWRARLRGDIAAARAALRELLVEPMRFTPFVERGYRAIRFEGRVGLTAIFGGDWVMNVASPAGFANSCNAKSLRYCSLIRRVKCANAARKQFPDMNGWTVHAHD